MTENQKKWVKTLRSGEYLQGKERLVQEEDNNLTYCCLGVACKLYEKETKEQLPLDSCGQYWVAEETLTDMPKVQEFFGLKSVNGYIPSMRTSLTQLNDIGKTFDEIADIIEQNAKELFEEE